MYKRQGIKTTIALLTTVALLSGCGEKQTKPDKTSTSEVTEAVTKPAGEITLLEKAEKPVIEGREKVDPNKITYADSYDFDKKKLDNITEADCDITVEAENANDADGITKHDDGSCSGTGFVDISDNTAFSLTVDIPSSQYYKISVSHKAGSHKENPIVINGQKVFDVVSEEGDWVVSEFDGIYLDEGENVITLGEGWSWFSMDYIHFEKGTTLSDDLYKIDNALLSNPYANLKTQNIYQYLQAIYGKRTLAGQCTDYGHNTETDALFLKFNKYPAVRTFDFIFDSFSYCKGQPAAKDVQLAKEWSADGGIVVFDWHWYAPSGNCAFYTKDTEFNISKAKPKENLDLTYMTIKDIQALYRAKEITVDTFMLYKDIDNIARLLQELEDADVTVLWRPLHEASGGWFWWGATGPEDYKWLWITLYERLTNYHGLDNLIWVWNAQDMEWYPGDEYCDISATDIYGPEHDYGTSPSTLKQMILDVNGKKPIAMSECATMPDPELIVRDNAYWLWFAVWNWDYIVVNGTTELSDVHTEIDMMEKVYNSDIIITRDELPEF